MVFDPTFHEISDEGDALPDLAGLPTDPETDETLSAALPDGDSDAEDAAAAAIADASIAESGADDPAHLPPEGA